MRSRVRLAVIGTTVAALAAATAAPALAASSGVPVSFASAAPGGTRTLVLDDTQGNALTALDMSSGTNSFIAKVLDSNNYVNKGYTVQATMSNLYGFNSGTGTWNCNQVVPSSKLSLTSPSSLLNVTGLAAGLTPVFSLSGNLSGILGGLLGLGSGTISGSPVTGLAQSLTQGNLVGAGNTGNLFGSTLTGLLGQLPIGILGNTTGSAFTNPDIDPTGSNCNIVTSGTNATQVPVMSGTANGSGLLSDVTNLVESLTGTTGTGLPNATQLISAGLLNQGSVLSLVCSVLSIACNLLSGLQITNILNTLTDNLTTSPLTLLSGVTGQSGTYSSQPGMAINTSGITAGGYKGTMTVTLVDN